MICIIRRPEESPSGPEEGELKSHYKHRASINSITKLHVNGTLTDNTIINGHCSWFYTQLYNRKYSQASADEVLGALIVKTIAEDKMKLHDGHLGLHDIKDTIALWKCYNSPDTDGLLWEFYQ